jgi:PEP-CTERM motif
LRLKHTDGEILIRTDFLEALQNELFNLIRSMKRTLLKLLIAAAYFTMGVPNTRAQGSVTYLSNIGQTPGGFTSVGSDFWIATPFITGSNPGGYLLGSVQLSMADSTGSPGGFTVMIYSRKNFAGVSPGSNLDTLSGPANPSAAGNYTYTSGSSLLLAPGSDYFIVVTAGTPVANGSYSWDYTAANNYNPSGGWTGGGASGSSDGTTWTIPTPGFLQYSLNATAAPEPGTLGLLALGGIVVGLRKLVPSQK